MDIWLSNVNDLMITSVSGALLDDTVSFIEITYKESSRVTISMEGYIHDLLKAYPDKLKRSATPATCLQLLPGDIDAFIG
eukprot:gene4401-8758_t